ncbi:MAG TPA: hypothetical protein VFD24_07410 [Chitinophagaceae bacterium]|jgi:predicted transcriptional regulator YdeE|nr:hypothetical protein [Chitinophagaceae bacterium]
METYDLKKDLKVFGKEVKTFPQAVKEAFSSLLNMIPDGFKRSYYGLSYMDDKGKMVYIATAEEKDEGEAEKYNCERYTVEKGEYLAVTLDDWLKKVDCIKDIFHEMMEDDRADKTRPVVEWYKTETEMLCLVRMKQHETMQ